MFCYLAFLRAHLQQRQQGLGDRRQVSGEEAVRMSIICQTPSPANPMNVGVQVGRKVIVDDIRQVLDVKTPCRNISGN